MLGKYDTIGQDLVAMVVDDLVVCGAEPLFMTDYIAVGKVFPARIAEIVSGIAVGCQKAGTALVGGETAEHPGLLGEDEFDIAGAATGAVDHHSLLGEHLVQEGDVLIAMPASGFHANGYSLVRHIIKTKNLSLFRPRQLVRITKHFLCLQHLFSLKILRNIYKTKDLILNGRLDFLYCLLFYYYLLIKYLKN